MWESSAMPLYEFVCGWWGVRGGATLLSHGSLESCKMNRIFIIMLGANIPRTSASVECIYTKM